MDSETLPNKMGPNKDVRDLSQGDCDAPNLIDCVMCVVMSTTSGIYWVELSFINNYKKFQL